MPASNHFISLQEAIEMTSRCREQKINVIKSEFQDRGIISNCETFDRESFDKLLAQEGCEGIRIYSGMDDTLKLKVIVVGVDEDNRDMLPSDQTALDEENNIIEQGLPCPPTCPPPSPLNE